MEEEIGKLKSVLRSLVVSSPTQVDVRSLLRDYRNMIGSPVPLRKFGYDNPVDFFKERFSDCFLFSGPTSNPVLTLIVPDTLKHIDKFVQKQKSSSTSKFNPKRRSVPEALVNNINRDKTLSKTNNKKLVSPQPMELSKESHEKPSSQQLNIRPTKSHISVNKPSITPSPTESHEKSSSQQLNIQPTKSHISVNKPSITPSPKSHVSASKPSMSPTKSFASASKPNISCSKHNGTMSFKSVYNAPHEDHTMHNGDTNLVNSHEVLEEKDETDSKTEDIPINSTDAVKNFFKKRLPMYTSEQYLDEASCHELHDKTLHDDTSEKYTTSSGSSAKARQLERLKQEMMELIIDAPDGVWCTDLIKLYKDRYNRELNFNRFGYTSILNLAYSLEEQVEITRPDATGDWLLQERRRGTPAPGAGRGGRARYRPAPRAAPAAPPAPNARASDSDDALPGIDFDPDVFPEDCMHFMESIESASVRDFRPGAMVEVIIGEVYSPSHFWFLRLGENYNIAMEDMMDEMMQYYRNEGQKRVLARGAVRVGHYCASLYERDWHRSIIVKIIDSDTVKVRHIDYGTVDTVAVAELKPLKRQWAALPAQACRARLAAVRPSAAGWRWPHAAATAFLALVTDRRLVANVVAVDERDDVAEVLLIDTASEEDVCIGTELIRAGHADARHDSALHTLELYLFPRFEALESGATPNYAEVHAYLRDGITLEYVPDYRDHVPLPLAPHVDRALPPLASDPPHPALPAYERPHESESSDSSEFVVNALDRSPPTSSETCVSSEFSKSTAESVIPVRIPLLLPATPEPQTGAEPVVAAEPALPHGCSERPAPPPPPPSHLSPHAPAYVPGAPYPYPPRPPGPGPYPACPSEFVRYAPPPCGGPLMPLRPGVTLSLDECETYRALSHVNPAAAHWFMVGAMSRAAAVDAPFAPPLYPMSPPVLAAPPPHTYPRPRVQMHPPVGIRPPPGFRSY